MGKYTELALNLREQKMQEDSTAMASIKDRFLTDVAEQIGKNGYCRIDFSGPKPSWWCYSYNAEVLVQWAKEEGFAVAVERFCGYGVPRILTIKIHDGLC